MPTKKRATAKAPTKPKATKKHSTLATQLRDAEIGCHLKATRVKPKRACNNPCCGPVLPDEVYLNLDGEPGSRGALDLCGWSIAPDGAGWLEARLERCLDAIKRDWREEFGAHWTLTIEGVS